MPFSSSPPLEFVGDPDLMSVEDVERTLARSKATIYRYANTDPKGKQLNMPYDPRYLNPEHRSHFREPLRFHPTEVARFAQEVLQIKEVKLEVLVSPRQETTALLRAILEELQAIRSLLASSRAVDQNENQS
jgi:hypothetical protein